MDQTGKGTIEDIILDLLLKGKSVVFPGFGYLEVVTLPDKKTVLFRNGDSSENVNKEYKSQLESLSESFASGKKVVFERIGTFTPILDGGAYRRISFIQSRYLKQALNGTEGAIPAPKRVSPVQPQEVPAVDAAKKEEVKETTSPKAEEVKVAPSAPEVTKKDVEASKSAVVATETPIKKEAVAATAVTAENAKPATVENAKAATAENAKKKDENIKKATPAKRDSDILRKPLTTPKGDAGRGETKTLGSKKGISPRLVSALLLLLVIAVVGYYFFLRDDDSSQQTGKTDQENVQQGDSSSLPLDDISTTNLLDLAEKYYGNKVFWVYIYDYNRDRIFSPVNLRSGDTIEIPDLSIYKVDPKDPAEVERAISIAKRQLGY